MSTVRDTTDIKIKHEIKIQNILKKVLTIDSENDIMSTVESLVIKSKRLKNKASDKKSLKKAVKIVKKNQDGEWKSLVKKELNKDSVVVRVVGPLLCKKGENNRVDELVFGAEKTAVNKAYPMMDKVGKKLKQPQSYKDVKSLVLTDYQESLEKVWVEKLRKQFTFDINQSVLSTVNNH